MHVTGAEALGRVIEDLHDRGVHLVLARVRTPLRRTLQILGLEEKIRPENLFLTVADATRDFTPATEPRAPSEERG
jgi:anti-anti-sigma regulatory factor